MRRFHWIDSGNSLDLNSIKQLAQCAMEREIRALVQREGPERHNSRGACYICPTRRQTTTHNQLASQNPQTCSFTLDFISLNTPRLLFHLFIRWPRDWLQYPQSASTFQNMKRGSVLQLPQALVKFNPGCVRPLIRQIPNLSHTYPRMCVQRRNVLRNHSFVCAGFSKNSQQTHV